MSVDFSPAIGCIRYGLKSIYLRYSAQAGRYLLYAPNFFDPFEISKVRAIAVLSYARRKNVRKAERKTEWVMRGYTAALVKSDYFAALGTLETVYTRAPQTGYFCSLFDFFLFFLDGVIKYGWAREAHGPLIWYLDGRGANINVRLPRAKPMPPRECFYAATTGSWVHVMPRHPIKLMSHAGFTRAVGLGEQVPP